jgi:hypothetical protein
MAKEKTAVLISQSSLLQLPPKKGLSKSRHITFVNPVNIFEKGKAVPQHTMEAKGGEEV